MQGSKPAAAFAIVLALLFSLFLPVAQGAERAIPFTVAEVKEKSFDNRPALAVVFTRPLKSQTSWRGQLRVLNADNAAIPGEWVLGGGDRTLYFPGVAPGTAYRVVVLRGIESANGITLANTSEHAVTTRALTPAFDFASRGSVLVPGVTDGLPVRSVEFPEVDLEFLRVKEADLLDFVRRYYGKGQPEYYYLSQISQHAESVYLGRFSTGAERYQRAVSHIPVLDIEELRKPGMYVAVMKGPGFSHGNHKSTFYFVSDIGLHLRRYADGMQVTATSLKSGTPLADVKLSVYQGSQAPEVSWYTDVDGVAVLDHVPSGILVAQSGEHFSVLNLDRPALDLSEFAIAGRPQSALESYLFSNRDLFRPGEALDLSLLLRNGDGGPVDALPLTLRLKQPDGRETTAVTLTPGAAGYLQHRFELPADGKTGRWRVEAYLDAGREPIGSFAFNVEEFMPERMKLSLESPKAPIGPADRWSVEAQGAFLYGGFASGNRFEAVLNVALAEHPLEQFKDYFFGDAEEAGKAYRETLYDGPLDAEGKKTLEVATKNDWRSPMSLRLTGNLFESGGRPIARTVGSVYWPAEELVGVRPLWQGEHADSYNNAEFELIRLGREGGNAPVSGLEVTLEEEEHDYYWYYSQGNGWQRDGSISRHAVASWNIDIGATGTARIHMPVRWGYYHLVVRDPATDLTTRYRFRAGWRHDNADVQSARPDAVALALDQAAYRIGERARLTVRPPAAGKVLVRVESDRLLWQQWVDAGAEGATLEIPVDPSWDGQHNLYVSAVAYRPGDRAKLVTPSRAVGVLHLPLDRSERKLEVALSAPERVEPETRLTVDVQVPGAAGQESYVVVAAVDSGILNITDFQTPDAAGYFFQRRRYDVEARDLFDQIIEAMEGRMAKPRFGGDADASVQGTRSRQAKAENRMVAFTTAAVTLDQEGRARVDFPLPDFNGELRLMAVAFTPRAYGSAERKVLVRAPVVAELTLPRFMAFDDQAVGSLELHNLSGKAQTLSLALSASAPLSGSGLPAQVTLADGERKLLRFALSAEPQFGVGEVAVTVKGDGIALNRRRQLGVRPSWPGDRRVHQAVLQPSDTLELPMALLDGLRENTIEATLTLAAQPPLDLHDAIKGLLRYPYGCLEQTTSAAYPHVLVDEVKAQVFGLEPLTPEERAKRVHAAIERVGGMQLSSGGFALWGREGREEMWLTPYVIDFLVEAREQGFQVPNEMLERGLARLEAMLRGSASFTMSHYRSDYMGHLLFASRAYAGYVLARLGRAPLGALRTLYDHERGSARSGLPMLHLAVALKLQGDGRRAGEAVSEALRSTRSEGYYGDYGSPIRDTALMIALLSRHDLGAEQRDALVFKLSDALRDRRWLSTQEKTAVFLAGDALMALAGRSVEAELLHNGEARAIRGSALRTVAVKDLRRGDVLRLQSRSRQPQYLTYTVTGYGLKPPAPLSEDYAIERTLFTLKGEEVQGRALRTGEFLLVRLTVNARRWTENLLVEDLLPAGLEVENLNIGRGEGLDNITLAQVNAGAAMRSDAIRHVEYRDDRFAVAAVIRERTPLNLFYLARVVSPGNFTWAPPMAEDMYDAERRGYGGTPGRLTVINTHP